MRTRKIEQDYDNNICETLLEHIGIRFSRMCEKKMKKIVNWNENSELSEKEQFEYNNNIFNNLIPLNLNLST